MSVPVSQVERPQPRQPILQTLRAMLAVLTARVTAFALRRLLRRNASAGPGIVANLVDPGLVGRALASTPHGLVLVSGSSGKSTTTKMLVDVLRAHGMSVFTNESTANLRQGIASSVIAKSTWTGALREDIAVVEIDEAAATQLGEHLDPRLLILTNVSSDQLDRFHSVEIITQHLRRIADRSKHVVLNADDANLIGLGANRPQSASWFGSTGAARDRFLHRMGYASTTEDTTALSEMSPGGTQFVDLSGTEATFVHHGHTLHLAMPARGAHYAIDAAAALEAAAVVLPTGVEVALAERAFRNLDPVFGRGEVVEISGQEVELVLVQNIASFQLNLDAFSDAPSCVMVAIGSDVRDTSWLWAVEFSALPHVDVVSGSKAYELAHRLHFEDVTFDEVDPDLGQALAHFLDLDVLPGQPKTIVFSADSMRRVRSMLGLAA
ncbi:MurT ligase domain-containing protein [Pseudoclavibacter helvolus]|uniref:MurT ligase domain-containing protein n=1 Tax=Pseudoclavibacter helvolus TaxID=255205 RepID=UPI0024AD707E|nr:MurT ligase domain-containing protein [Pseudoclavibacter helvolus]